jgi:hypothetical protein
MKNILTLTLLIPLCALNQTIYYESAEGNTIFGTYVKKQTTTTYGITIANNIAYTGTKSARFELRDSDAMNNNGTRAEISFPTITNLNRWYSFALHFPSIGYAYDKSDEVIMQWHQGGGATPALCLRTKNDRIYLRILGSGGTLWIDLGLIDKDKWHSYVMHVVHSSGSSGVIDIWRDDNKILNITGPNMYKVTGDFKNPNWKLGIYKSDWNNSETTATSKRVLYFDDIKMGSEKATYADMKP